MSELNEPVATGTIVVAELPAKEPCKRIYIHAFLGDRSPAAVASFKSKLAYAKQGDGSAPTDVECLLYTGHVGISFEADSPIFGFNPETGSQPSWQVIENLKQRAVIQPYPGKVTDDTHVFSTAAGKGLKVLKLELVYPQSEYDAIQSKFQSEKAHSALRYSFPGGGGDCNCATWPARLGIFIPERSGAMKHYVEALGGSESPRRMGLCEG